MGKKYWVSIMLAIVAGSLTSHYYVSPRYYSANDRSVIVNAKTGEILGFDESRQLFSGKITSLTEDRLANLKIRQISEERIEVLARTSQLFGTEAASPIRVNKMLASSIKSVYGDNLVEVSIQR